MAKPSVIKLPNGTVIEVSNDLTPDQITALITAVTSNNPPSTQPSIEEPMQSGKTIIHERTAEEIWLHSKKERVALFIRNYLSEQLWFNAKDIQDQQIAITGKLSLGETSAIGTYLTRLFEVGYLDRKKSVNERNVFYRINEKLIESYPLISQDVIQQLVEQIV
ncbi:MAG: hypothetical protein ACXAD7_05785 [Candidatus Kariarchaeaceae archaeon]|jgi:hypothetical protein